MSMYVRDNRPELVHPGGMRDRLAGVLGVAGKAEGLGAVEGDRVACLAGAGRIGANEGGLFSGLSLGILGCGCDGRVRACTSSIRECALFEAAALPLAVFVEAIS